MIEERVYIKVSSIDEMQDKLHSWVEHPNSNRMDYELRCKNCGAIKLTSKQVAENDFLKENSRNDLELMPPPLQWIGAKHKVLLPNRKTYYV